jgi:hypothetical protein
MYPKYCGSYGQFFHGFRAMSFFVVVIGGGLEYGENALVNVGFLENSRNLMTFCRNLSNLTHLFP